MAKTNPKADMPEDDDDLIGDVSLVEEPISTTIDEVWGGVSAHWLSQVFSADKMTIKKKLAEGGCTIVGKNKGSPLYSIAEAAQFLVKPKVDLAKYISRMRPQDMPPILHAAFWDGKIKRQTWEKNAGLLWHTEDVAKVLGELAVTIKTSVSLWAETVERSKGLTKDQRDVLVDLCDDLLKDIHENLVDAPKRSRTPSSIEDRHEEEDAEEEIDE